MFGISFGELLIIGIVVLIVFGPERLPEMARVLGKLSFEFRKASDSVRKEFYNSVYPPDDDLKKLKSDLTSELRTMSRSIEALPSAAVKSLNTTTPQVGSQPLSGTPAAPATEPTGAEGTPKGSPTPDEIQTATSAEPLAELNSSSNDSPPIETPSLETTEKIKK